MRNLISIVHIHSYKNVRFLKKTLEQSWLLKLWLLTDFLVIL